MKHKVKWFSILSLCTGLIILGACSSAPKTEVNSDDAINDALISFTYNAQGGRYSDALECLTYDDQLKLIDGNGNIKEEYRVAMTRVKLSSLQKMPFTLDFKGRLEGMIAVLDDANRKFTMSQEQRSTNLKQVEKTRKEVMPTNSVPDSSTNTPEPTDTTEELANGAASEDTVPSTPEDKPLTIDEYLK